MSHCLSCLCPDAGTPCRECGYTQIRHAPGARLGPLVRTPRTPRAELARQERLLTAALLELGALEGDREPLPLFGPDGDESPEHMDWRWALADKRALVESFRAKRDLAAQAVAS